MTMSRPFCLVFLFTLTLIAVAFPVPAFAEPPTPDYQVGCATVSRYGRTSLRVCSGHTFYAYPESNIYNDEFGYTPAKGVYAADAPYRVLGFGRTRTNMVKVLLGGDSSQPAWIKVYQLETWEEHVARGATPTPSPTPVEVLADCFRVGHHTICPGEVWYLEPQTNLHSGEDFTWSQSFGVAGDEAYTIVGLGAKTRRLVKVLLGGDQSQPAWVEAFALQTREEHFANR